MNEQEMLQKEGLELIVDPCPNTEPLRMLESVETPAGPHTGVVLATLDGPAMDYINPTRNIRLYTEDLCDDIHDSEYVAELIETKNFLGEPDHPMRYQNRLDIHYPEVSHAIRNFRKVPEKGCYYITIDILDTPNGRILKTLLDYGVKLGISSRGSGRTITKNGQIIVDKRTYRFITFDVVCMPGNKVARMPTLGESTAPKSLTEQVEQLLDAKDLDSLRSIQPVLNFLSENAEVSTLRDRIEEVLSVDASNTITESATADLLEAYGQISALKKQLSDKDSIISDREGEIARLEEVNRQLQDTNSELSEKLTRSTDLVKTHLQKEQSARSLLESTQIKLSKLTAANSSLQEALSSANRTQSMNEAVVSTLKSTIEAESEKSSEQIGQLQESLDQAQADLESMTEQLEYSNHLYEDLMVKYFNVRCSQLGLKPDLLRMNLNESLSTYSLEELEGILQDAFKRKPKKPVSPLTESFKVGGSKIQASRPQSAESRDPMLESIRDSARAVRNQ